jgi:GNAT superfamily N-acetyltransferase
MEIRTAQKDDLQQLLSLYAQLPNNPLPIFDDKLENLWHHILADENHHLIVGVVDNRIISTCVLIVVLNLTRSQRPYALIENVITDINYRNNGYASAILNYAKTIAIDANCYKIMLMTGSKRESTLAFYEKVGYNKNDKTGFVQLLD